MTFDAARRLAATKTGNSLSTAEVTTLLTEMESLIGRRPDEIVGPNLRLRWIQDDGTYTLKLLPTVTPNGHLSWNLGYSNHRDKTLQTRESTTLTSEIFDLDVQAAMPYLWMVSSHSRADMTPLPVPSWAQLVVQLGRAFGELPATLAALPSSWFGDEAVFVDRTRKALDLHATRNGLRVRLRGTKDKEGPAPDAALVLDPVAALEAGFVLAWAFASAYDLGTPLESIDVSLDVPGIAFRSFCMWPEINDEVRLDSNVSPNYQSHSQELFELATWRGAVDDPFPTSLPAAFSSTDQGKFGVVVTEAEKKKARARARTQRTINVRNAAAAEAAARDGVVASPVQEANSGTSRPWWKFWAAS